MSVWYMTFLREEKIYLIYDSLSFDYDKLPSCLIRIWADKNCKSNSDPDVENIHFDFREWIFWNNFSTQKKGDCLIGLGVIMSDY